jgi:MbtH protein
LIVLAVVLVRPESFGEHHTVTTGRGQVVVRKPAILPEMERGRRMSDDELEDTTIYSVVVNYEEQYSIWPADRELPLGWKEAGKRGLKAECLAYINEVWTDMRPLSLRKKMAENAGG